MKKFFKAFVLAVLVCGCVGLIAGCSKTYRGEYHYNSWGTEQGVKVKVEVEDDVIKSVRIVGSEYVDVTGAMGNWTKEDVNNWYDNVKSLLKKYEGMKVDEVMALNAEINGYGQLTTDKSELGEVLIDGATLGSARVLLAVQNALKGE